MRRFGLDDGSQARQFVQWFNRTTLRRSGFAKAKEGAEGAEECDDPDWMTAR